MLIYVDESYPDNQDKIILGALFVDTNDHKRLHAKIQEIKRSQKFNSEIKYSEINDKTRYNIARRIVNEYFKTTNSYFNACVIPYSATKLINCYGIDTNQKRVNVYTSGAKNLILGNLLPESVSDVYFDEEDRIKKTKLFSKLKKSRSPKGGKINEVYSIKSNDESKCVLQLCDLLTGAIKQNLYPSNTSKSKFKRKFSEHVLKVANVSSCSELFWTKKLKSKNHKKYSKFYISHFEVPNYFQKFKRTAVSTVKGDSI